MAKVLIGHHLRTEFPLRDQDAAVGPICVKNITRIERWEIETIPMFRMFRLNA